MLKDKSNGLILKEFYDIISGYGRDMGGNNRGDNELLMTRSTKLKVPKMKKKRPISSQLNHSQDWSNPVEGDVSLNQVENESSKRRRLITSGGRQEKSGRLVLSQCSSPSSSHSSPKTLRTPNSQNKMRVNPSSSKTISQSITPFSHSPKSPGEKMIRKYGKNSSHPRGAEESMEESRRQCTLSSYEDILNDDKGDVKLGPLDCDQMKLEKKTNEIGESSSSSIVSSLSSASSSSLTSSSSSSSIVSMTRKKRRRRGLKNLGSSCFLNSLIQSFSSSLPSTSISDSDSDQRNMENTLLSLLSSLQSSHLSPLSPPPSYSYYSYYSSYLPTSSTSSSSSSTSSHTTSLISLLFSLSLSPYIQQDVHECFTNLLSLLQTSRAEKKKKMKNDDEDEEDDEDENDSIPSHFSTQLIRTIHCTKCGKERRKREPCLSLSLSFSDQSSTPPSSSSSPYFPYSSSSSSYHHPPSSSLSSLLSLFFSHEMCELECDDCLLSSTSLSSFPSPSSPSSTKPIKSLSSISYLLSHPPPILVLHIKRFTLDEYGRSSKLHHSLSIPPSLSLSQYLLLHTQDEEQDMKDDESKNKGNDAMNEKENIPQNSSHPPSSSASSSLSESKSLLLQPPPSEYSLSSIIHHHGASLQSGHYSCHIRVRRGGGGDDELKGDLKCDQEWLRCDDSVVEEVEGGLDEILSTSPHTPYLLFYTLDL